MAEHALDVARGARMLAACIREVASYEGEDNPTLAFADYTVNAVNSHDALLAAARTVVDRHRTHAVKANFQMCGCDECVVLRAAIAKAEGR